MASKPIYSDLFAFGRGSIVWLRIFRLPDADAVALAIHPVAQPGAGPVNDAEALVAAVGSSSPELDGLRLLARFPEDPSEEGWIEIRVGEDGQPDFGRHATCEVEALVGAPLPDPPNPTCAGIASPDHTLLALLPEEEERDPLAELTVIAVATCLSPTAPSVGAGTSASRP